MTGTLISMAIASGMTSTITNPLHPELMQAVRGANVIMGNDPQRAAWMRNYREPATVGGDCGRRSTRRQRTQDEPGVSV
jgi:5-methyltetrahydrofolate--homocysteine methyltransferase